MLVEHVVQGTHFLRLQILGLVELPEVLFLSLLNDNENKGNGLANSPALGELEPGATGHFGDVLL